MNSISYIIPHYNSVESLKRLLDSITLIDQDEIIVIDDCSSNTSLIELQKLQKNKRFRLLSTGKNGGAGKARNIGMDKASNKWLIFADSDDYFVPDYRDLLKKYTNKEEIDIVYFTPTSISESKNSSVRTTRHEYYEYLVSEYLKGSKDGLNSLKYKFVVPWSKLINRDYVSAHGFKFDEVYVSNDVMFSAKTASETHRILATKDVIYCCVESDNSLTSDISVKQTLDRLDVFIEYYKYIELQMEKNEFYNLNIVGLSYLVLAIRNSFSISDLMIIYKKLKRNNIRILTVKYLKETISRF